MELRQEDTLRLHVLIDDCDAVRIDESRMQVTALKEGQERQVNLNPNCRDESYLKMVRELLSAKAVNSPGGYPVFLSRWTRMGQLDSKRLAALLRLGEPEAVVAVASSPALGLETAKLAWWALPTAEVARFLLKQPVLENTELAREIGEFLLEFIPFETEPSVVATSVRLVAQHRILSEERRLSLWKRSQRKSSILLGLIMADPFGLPMEDSGKTLNRINVDPDATPPILEKLRTDEGRVLLNGLQRVLQKPSDQDIVVMCLDLIGKIFIEHSGDERLESMPEVLSRIELLRESNSCWTEQDAALWLLSNCGEQMVKDYCSTSSAIGSLMRKQLSPILDPVVDALKILSGTDAQ